MKRCTVATIEIPGAFLQADMDKLVYVKFEGLMLELLYKIDPNIYENYMVIEQGQHFCMQPSFTRCMGTCEIPHYYGVN